MKIYWSYHSIPELAEMPKDEHRMIWKKHSLKAFKHWQTWIAFAVCAACATSGVIMVECWGSNVIIGAIGTVIGGAIGGFILGQVIVTMGRRYVRETLNSEQKK